MHVSVHHLITERHHLFLRKYQHHKANILYDQWELTPVTVTLTLETVPEVRICTISSCTAERPLSKLWVRTLDQQWFTEMSA